MPITAVGVPPTLPAAAESGARAKLDAVIGSLDAIAQKESNMEPGGREALAKVKSSSSSAPSSAASSAEGAPPRAGRYWEEATKGAALAASPAATSVEPADDQPEESATETEEHGDSSLFFFDKGDPDSSVINPASTTAKATCVFFLRGNCRAGEFCNFSHEISADR